MYARADGERVRELREERGATPKEIAQKAGITPETLRRVEGNRGPVRVDTVHAIGRVLDVDPRTFAKAVSRRQSRHA